MRCAVTDIGSNTVRMNVYDFDENKKNTAFIQLFSEKETPGLVNYVRKGILTRDGIDRLISTLTRLNSAAIGVSSDKILFFATASLRNIANTEEITDAVRCETGINIDVISGEDEARCSFEGVKLMLGDAVAEHGIMMDIGGGSTEILSFSNDAPKHAVSLPFGCLSLHKKYAGGILPDKTERREISEHIRKRMKNIGWLEDCSDTIYLVGGTGRAAARLHREVFGSAGDMNGYRIDSAAIEYIYSKLSKPNRSEVRLMIKTIPDRLHTIIPGLEICLAALEISGAKRIIISRGGVREGYMKLKFPEFMLR